MIIKAIRISVYKNQQAFELKRPSIKVGMSCSACKQKKSYCANSVDRNPAKCLFTSELARDMQLPIRLADENGVRRVSIVMERPWSLPGVDEVLQQIYKKYSR